MNVAILAESDSDEAAIRCLVNAILGVETEHIPHLPRLRARGWSQIPHVLPSWISKLSIQPDAHGLVVVADSDRTAIHTKAHDSAPQSGNCRVCHLLEISARQLSKTKLTHGRRVPLKIAIGLAVPAIEAWLLCGEIPHVNEAAWARHLGGEKLPYTQSTLKAQLFDPHVSESERKQIMVSRARERSKDIAALETNFPGGFGVFKTELSQWK